MAFSGNPTRHRHWLLGIAVAVLGLLTTAWLAQQQARSVAAISEARFLHEAKAFSDALAQRMAANTEIVNGLRGLFMVNPVLSRAEFERVARELDVRQRYPGVRNLAFTRYVTASQRPAFEERVRADRSVSPAGRPDFAIHPAGERPEYFVAEYLWPEEGSNGVLGLDISAQPANLAAMHYSRDSGKTVVSAPFDLLQEQDHRTAFVLRVPVFGPARPGEAPPFLGAVASTIRVHDLVGSLRKLGYMQGIAVSITDQGPLHGGAAGKVAEKGMPLLALSDVPLTSAVLHEVDLDVHDRRWRLGFLPTQDFLSPSERRLPMLTGLAGALVSALLAALVVLLGRQRALAWAQVQVSDDARRQSEERLSAVFKQAAVGMAQIDSQTGRFVRVNQKYADIVGYSVAQMCQTDFQAITHPEDLAEDLAHMERMKAGEIAEFHMEKRYFHRDGHTLWVDLTVSPMWTAGAQPDYHIAVVQDITARKQMENSLRGNELRLRGILQRLPVGVCLVQPDGHMVFRNERFVQICGYTEADVPTGTDWWPTVYPDAQYRERARAEWTAARARAIEGDGTIESGEYTIQCKDGQQRTVEIAGVMVDGGHLFTLVDLSQRKADEEEIRYLAFYDPLTRLPNRRLLMDRLQQALAASARHRRSGALLLLDLDNFKTLNETQGHERGDLLLLQVAQRLRGCVLEDDTVARQGGDEFVMVLEDLGDNPEEAAARSEEIGQKILAALREPYQLDGEAHHSSLSMGITVFSGMRETVDELLRRADLAMYQAKAAGRDTLRFYDPQMQAVVSARAAMELDMRAGLALDQFELYYQPQMEHGRITGAEALLRWRHPHNGFISPARFISLAEESGLILPLGEWVLKAACERLALWADQPGLAPLDLAVNVSPRQFHQGGFVPQVLAALAGSGADGHRLKLELTEGLLLQDVEDTIEKMGQLRGYGVGFSLDDFGTGYSSLAYLKRLPLDQLKIDQSFVRDVLTDPNDAAIARTVVGLATSLGLRVIAEGVETEAQREFLARNHCHAWQGYLSSPPVPAAEFEALVLQTNGPLRPRAA
ncbi:bifunctional diguanylate cyclase/phosphodiesterase [Acidovorax carolinensis]|uniref:Bifunctional diguanylate cyclase/phosphodiesterase n=2 Tax=Acidovorax carolinensis TaxID=553814 RepID=A0A240UD75_9BURK|nr:EAL domain-containing protein [Acidovorax carolinensis]ART59002.1 bifunctional diguanylate cyclase/phosphodiesterase [Acidovorax carolinensis]